MINAKKFTQEYEVSISLDGKKTPGRLVVDIDDKTVVLAFYTKRARTATLRVEADTVDLQEIARANWRGASDVRRLNRKRL